MQLSKLYHQLIPTEFNTADEVSRLISLSWPSSFTSIAFIGTGLVNSMVMGHLGTVELAAVAYSDIVMEYTLMLFLQGFNQGLRALCSQAFGAKQYVSIGQYTQLALVAILSGCIPLSIIWWYNGSVLRLFGHPHNDTIEYATLYSRISCASLIPRLVFSVLSTYFVSQHIVLPTAIIAISFLFFHAAAAWILVHGVSGVWLGLGFIGCPIATGLTMWLRLAVYVTYMCLYRKLHLATWRWTTEFWSLKRFALLTKVGVPLMLGNAFENGQLQLCALFASSLGQPELAAHSSMLQLFMFLSCPIYGLNSGGITRIGYYLGANEPYVARAVSLVLLGCILSIATAVVIFYIASHGHLGKLFSNDPAVYELITEITVLAGAGYFFLSFFYYSMATLTAQARSTPILVAFFLGAWGVGVPTAYILGCTKVVANGSLSLLGIWIGMSCGYFVTTIVGVIAAFGTDWEQQAALAEKRSRINTSRSNSFETQALL